MAVCVNGELDRRVPQQLLNHHGVFPGHQENRSEAVAEIVWPDAWQVPTIEEPCHFWRRADSPSAGRKAFNEFWERPINRPPIIRAL
jgi:hypothetical protein